MKPYRVLPASENDLFDIWSYIAGDNPDIADRIEQEIRATFARLAEHPHLGHTRHDLITDNSLFFTVRSVYQIIYEPNAEPLTILRVLRGGRDVRAELESENS